MEYTVRTGEKTTGGYKDGQGQEWGYITPAQYKDRPREEKRICADMRKQDSGSMERLLSDGEKHCGLYEYRGKRRWHEKITGYVPVEAKDNPEMRGYVRIVEKSMVKSLLVFLLILLAAVGIAVGIMQLRQEEGPVLDEAAVAYKVDGMVNTEPGQTMLPYISKIEMYEGEKVKHVLANPEGNKVYFQFQLTLDQTGETLYKSDLVEPGKAILEFELSREMEPGTYPVTLEIKATSIEDSSAELNGGESKAELFVYEE